MKGNTVWRFAGILGISLGMTLSVAACGGGGGKATVKAQPSAPRLSIQWYDGTTDAPIALDQVFEPMQEIQLMVDGTVGHRVVLIEAFGDARGRTVATVSDAAGPVPLGEGRRFNTKARPTHLWVLVDPPALTPATWAEIRAQTPPVMTGAGWRPLAAVNRIVLTNGAAPPPKPTGDPCLDCLSIIQPGGNKLDLFADLRKDEPGVTLSDPELHLFDGDDVLCGTIALSGTWAPNTQVTLPPMAMPCLPKSAQLRLIQTDAQGKQSEVFDEVDLDTADL